jgi:parallel beta-helix repeat protein
MQSRSRLRMLLRSIFFCSILAMIPANITKGDDLKPQTYSLSPSDDVQFKLQSLLIEAVPGDVIQLEAGRYLLQRQLDVAAQNITIRGRGSNQTILSFKGQTSGGQGMEATGDNFTLEALAIEDTAGNAVKVLGAKNVTMRDVRVEWTGTPSADNGAYGIYPVQCQNVLLENCTAIGASDAGLYVGQCQQVVVRSCRAERNVAGIEIENTIDADVFDNVATNNSGGILVFDMPGLPLKAGRNARIFRNKLTANNHRNFADPGAIVAAVPPGTGVMVMASDHVEVFDNDIHDHQTVNVMVVSYLVLDKKIGDSTFDAIPEFVSIHDNRISKGGEKPAGMMATLLTLVLGNPFPDILWDGVINPATGKSTLRIADNGGATFANFDLARLTSIPPPTNADFVKWDLTPHSIPMEPLQPVSLVPHTPPSTDADAAVRVYRSLPKNLSEFRLFVGRLAEHHPAEGVVLYDLNTPLFSDYAEKRRFIKVPEGTQIEYREHGILDFPEGTVISKTFSYPHNMTDASLGERLLETRIELLRDGAWYGASYIWNDEQSEATLALGGSEVEVAWVHADGRPRSTSYEIPNANQCLNCHRQDKAFLPIGPTARNLNRPRPSADSTENQLAYFERVGLIDNLPDSAAIPQLPRFDDAQASTIDHRARAWLDVNCAHCHNPLGTARTSGLDLSWDQNDPAKWGVWKNPVAAGHASGGREYDIVPGKPDASILVHRLESDDPSIRMPSVGRHLVHDESTKLIRAWIAGMPTGE